MRSFALSVAIKPGAVVLLAFLGSLDIERHDRPHPESDLARQIVPIPYDEVRLQPKLGLLGLDLVTVRQHSKSTAKTSLSA